MRGHKMNPRVLATLRYLSEHNGRAPISELLENVEGFDRRLIGSITIGNNPNCIRDGDYLTLTERGQHSVGGTETIAPGESRVTPPSGVRPILVVRLDRNEYLTVSCKIDKKLADWIKANGRIRDVGESHGDGFARNWDCRNGTKFVDINLRGVDDNFRGNTNIISEHGINSLIVKIAAAQPNHTWKVSYKGLVSKEEILRYSQQLYDNVKHFYVNYVKPIHVEVTLSITE
jgi:hypothetical protein